MHWMTKLGRAAFRSSSPRRTAPASPTSTATSTSTSASATPARWPGTRPSRPCARSPSRRARGITPCCRREDAIWVGEELDPPLRPAAAGSSRSPRPTPTASRSGSRAQITGRPKILVFNWCYHGTVDETFADHSTTAAAVVASRATSARRSTSRDHAGRRVQRRRGARARARARRRRLRADRAGADEHRHRAARAGLPRGARARLTAQDGDAADHRRDAHDLRRSRRLHAA